MSESILNIDSITKSFVKNIVNVHGNNEDERYFIIDDLDLLVPKGKITALIGGNGAGKTTLFNIISGFVESDSGTVLYNDKSNSINISKMKPEQIARIGIGRMFQDNHIFQNLSVLENMLIADSNTFGEIPINSFFRTKKNKEVEENKIEKAKEIFENIFGNNNSFWERKNDKAKNLSYGQKRLLGLTRLLMGNYQLLLLDEPSAGVNASIIPQIMEIIKSFVDDKDLTVFLIEHNMKVVLDIADFCCFMSHGKIAALGTPDDVISNDEVRKIYMGA
ncbi:MAG: ATP-binding cassette domain-containing protein [Ignavibacteriaceae bacterium]|nr:ATP-binding cassette domain-containing protein [Ignavibacteriaceae bacterium]